MPQAQEACGRRQQEIDSALEMIRELDRELEDLRKAALTSQLRPLPGDNVSACPLLPLSLPPVLKLHARWLCMEGTRRG